MENDKGIYEAIGWLRKRGMPILADKMKRELLEPQPIAIHNLSEPATFVSEGSGYVHKRSISDEEDFLLVQHQF